MPPGAGAGADAPDVNNELPSFLGYCPPKRAVALPAGFEVPEFANAEPSTGFDGCAPKSEPPAGLDKVLPNAGLSAC
jgi:hypothetical protein